MKYMIKYKSKDGATMTLTDYGFVPDMFYAPRFFTSREAGAVTNAIESILISEAGFTRDDINRLCIHQEAV